MDLVSLIEQQTIIEEIFLEFESKIIGNKGYDGNDEDSLDFAFGNNSQNELIFGASMKLTHKYFPKSSEEWSSLSIEERKKLKYELLQELKKKKQEIEDSIKEIRKTVEKNQL